jgi:hypothetical protein
MLEVRRFGDSIGSAGNHKLYIAVFTIQIFVLVIGVSWYFKRRQFSPIKERPQLLTMSTLTAFNIVTLLYEAMDVVPLRSLYCFPILVIVCSCFISTVGSLSARLFFLWWSARITEKKIAYAGSLLNVNINQLERNESSVVNWIVGVRSDLNTLKNQAKWVRTWSIFDWSVGLIATLISFAAKNCSLTIPLFEFVTENTAVSIQCDKMMQTNYAWMMAIMSTIVCAAAFLWYKLRGVRDNYYVKQELLQLSVLMIPPAIYILLVITSQTTEHFVLTGDWNYGTAIFLGLNAFGVVVVSCGIPIWRSYSSEFNQIAGTAESEMEELKGAPPAKRNIYKSLDHMRKEFLFVLSDSECSQLFQKFLEREWSVENILFWNAVRDFKSKFDGLDENSQESMAHKIYNEYVTESAALCVNLPYEVRIKISKVINDESFPKEPISCELFKAAEEEIFQLMLRDSYRRFVHRANDSGYSKVQERLTSNNNPATIQPL